MILLCYLLIGLNNTAGSYICYEKLIPISVSWLMYAIIISLIYVASSVGGLNHMGRWHFNESECFNLCVCVCVYIAS